MDDWLKTLSLKLNYHWESIKIYWNYNKLVIIDIFCQWFYVLQNMLNDKKHETSK